MKERDAQKIKPATCCWQKTSGYQNLLKIVGCPTDGFYYFIARNSQHAEGLIILRLPLAEVPRLLEQGQQEKARQVLDWYYEVFGRENFFLELQEHNLPSLNVSTASFWNSDRANARFIATQ
jgi:DNA polymerase-3 subunit alpha